MTKPYSTCLLLLALMHAPFVGARGAHAQERYIYWIGASNAEETQGNTIFRYTLDSSVVDTLVHARDLSSGDPLYFFYVTVDTLGEKIYWTDSGGTEPDGTVLIGAIRRASLAGDSVEVFLGGIICGLGSLSDIEVDAVERYLYWGQSSDCPGSGLIRTNLEGQNDPRILAMNGNYVVLAISLDTPNGTIYWTHNDRFSLTNEPLGVRRASLSDREPEFIIEGEVCDIALAHVLSKIYWIPCNGNNIRRSNLDGTGTEDMIVSQGNPTNIAVDDKANKIYWTETGEGKIRRANLDGTEVEDLVSGLVMPTSIALSFGWDISVGVEQGEEIPNRANLHSNYPNPFQESTTIAFNLTESGHVTLEIYDQLGRRIEVLASHTYPPGAFRVQWSPKEQANGVYFCRMTFQNKSKTTPLVIQR